MIGSMIGGGVLSCSTPFGITEENISDLWHTRARMLCAQRLSASLRKTFLSLQHKAKRRLCSTPFGITEENILGAQARGLANLRVLNAFRHH